MQQPLQAALSSYNKWYKTVGMAALEVTLATPVGEQWRLQVAQEALDPCLRSVSVQQPWRAQQQLG